MAQVPTGPTSPSDDPETYTGLRAEAAEHLARTRGWTLVRTLPPDAIVTMEYQEGRLNFAVVDEVVVRCWKG
jgi:hypothetical protein